MVVTELTIRDQRAERHRAPIPEIIVSGRHRQDMGDIESLMDSIEAVGLLQPIVITPDDRLVAGQRRLEACRRLGWTFIPVHIVERLSDAYAALCAERDENTWREDMKPGEKASLGMALEELERPKAKEREEWAKGGAKHPSEKFTEGSRGQTRDIVGAAVGMSGITYQRAKVIVMASEDESLPADIRAAAGTARDEMDRTGKVTRAYNKVAPLIGKAPTKNGKPKKPRTDVKPQTRTYRGRSAADSAVAAIGTLVGVASGLRELAMNDIAPTAEEREAWEKELASVVSSINRFRKHLKGSCNGQG